MEHFNKLTPKEQELLAVLSEECGEVVQAIGKILRHGLESRHPDGGPTNREHLFKEATDVVAAVRMLCEGGVIRLMGHEDVMNAREAKQRYLHHARFKGSCGCEGLCRQRMLASDEVDETCRCVHGAD